ncbi:FKBP-type peptidyl-prolyl cis-trans isomerase FkpA [Lutibacter sp. Hel_I_33_5]|uniref:FKBP-type peptidyl-prolyl cis-trans isomerase n=1 Tax=Lutibacter sp. Hel_I_33_5 TaxID=1566289 RepID=UPI0011A206AB|nr:FKBP-type peptidyl-prolyl cis-trans isomerase [Lutibacter sp. Hel_I_33_5]TVZ56902.1 FKBP-type peptidyl-prolyl cis-trans isomerase FkpA [Lutibacter sp. Hel_I_33_5]
MKSIISIVFVTLLFVSCSSTETIEEEVIDYDSLNEIEIQDYISKNNLTPKKSSTGLYYIIIDKGTGKTPTLSSNVTVYYKGYTTDGIVFEESPDIGVNYDLNRLIPGFSEGITYLQEGGSAKLIIPSKIGYSGKLSSFNPLGGKVIIFDIKLISVN